MVFIIFDKILTLRFIGFINEGIIIFSFWTDFGPVSFFMCNSQFATIARDRNINVNLFYDLYSCESLRFDVYHF